MLRPFAHPVSGCWMLLRVVAQSLKPVNFSANDSQHCGMLHVASVCTPCFRLLDVVACCCAKFEAGQLFSQRLPIFRFCCWSVAQQCWIRLLGPRTLITHGLQRLMGCILPTMHCRSQHCWELLHPFAHHCQHARRLFASRLMEEMLYVWVPVHLFFSLPHIFTLVAASISPFLTCAITFLSVLLACTQTLLFLKFFSIIGSTRASARKKNEYFLLPPTPTPLS